jgi:hypothetical protein
MGVERIYSRVHTTTNEFLVNYYNFHIILAELSRSAKEKPVEFGSPHEATCAGFVDIYLPILHSY